MISVRGMHGIISSHLTAVRTPGFSEVKRIIALAFSEVKRTIHLLLYVDFVLLYDDFDCNIFFGPVIRHEYCNTFANYCRQPEDIRRLHLTAIVIGDADITHMEPQPKWMTVCLSWAF